MSYSTIKLRRGSAAQWAANNPTLALGEYGYETDTRKSKVGDGLTAWNSLAYQFGQAVSGVDEAIEARQAINADTYVNAKDFGATGDGTTDDTTALQNWINYIVTNKRQGWLPNGTYKITASLNIAEGFGWEIHGENRNESIIKQFTSNTPVIKFLGTGVSLSHSYTLENFMLTYNTAQPSTNTNANNILFECDGTYWITLKKLRLVNGYYGIKVKELIYPPWGSIFDDLISQAMSGGFLDWYNTTSGVPNNKWGRITVRCDNATGPMMSGWRGTNTQVDTIEFLAANASQNLITTGSGFSADIGAIKLEGANYTTATDLFNFAGDHLIRIGHILVEDSGTFTPASGTLSVVRAGQATRADSWLEIGTIDLGADTLTGSCVAVRTSQSTSLPNQRVVVGNVSLKKGWTLQYTGGHTTGDGLTVKSWVNNMITTVDKGDADYTVAVGDPNILRFATTFTGQRTITLPASAGNNLCAGLYYDLVFDGAINGTNTAVIKNGSTTLRTQTVDKKKLRYVWRRGNGTGAWVLTDISDIGMTGAPAQTADVQVFTSSGTWTKPTGATAVTVRCISPGGGGGAGARGPSGTALSGGGGGSAGGMTETTFAASDLPSTVSVTVGTGGAGATGQTSDGSAGANGSPGNNSTSFGTYVNTGRGGGGTGGGLGVAGSGSGGSASGWSLGMFNGAAGAAGSATGAAGAGGPQAVSGGGGGGGGGITAAASATAGGVGGKPYINTLTGGAAGDGSAGGAGGSSTVRGPGQGGAGGGGNVSGGGYAGGDGGNYGAGGGGGGASLNGSTSGAGGKGGDGICVVTTYF